jgi:hypothetical protein
LLKKSIILIICVIILSILFLSIETFFLDKLCILLYLTRTYEDEHKYKYKTLLFLSEQHHLVVAFPDMDQAAVRLTVSFCNPQRLPAAIPTAGSLFLLVLQAQKTNGDIIRG